MPPLPGAPPHGPREWGNKKHYLPRTVGTQYDSERAHPVLLLGHDETTVLGHVDQLLHAAPLVVKMLQSMAQSVERRDCDGSKPELFASFCRVIDKVLDGSGLPLVRSGVVRGLVVPLGRAVKAKATTRPRMR
jgi:hypothetical protein